MPLHVAKLRDSDLAAECEPEACWYAVLLWCSSWHQLPAGSLPDNDTVLCKLIGLGRDLKTWRAHREQALRGWYLASDGRLYHPVVAQEVVKAWRARVEQFWRTECARVKKANQRNGTELPTPTLEDFLTGRAPATKEALSQGKLDLVPEDTPSRPEGQTAMSLGKTHPRERDTEQKGQGHTKKKDDDDARTPARSDPFGPIGDLAARFGRASGVAVLPTSTRFADQLDTVREWLAMGLDPDTEIIPALEQDAATTKQTRHSLKYFTPSMAKIAARKDATANGRSHEPQANLRGSRPDPALDLYRAACAAEEAERSAGNSEDRGGDWLSLPSGGSS